MPLPPAPPPLPLLINNNIKGVGAIAPPPPPPNFGKGGPKSGAPPPAGDRSNLLNEIRKTGGLSGNIKLRKVATNDRSAPIVAGSSAKSANSSSPNAAPIISQNGTLKQSTSNNSGLNFQDQLNAAIRGGGIVGKKLNPSNSSNSLQSSPSHGANNKPQTSTTGSVQNLVNGLSKASSPKVASSQSPSPPAPPTLNNNRPLPKTPSPSSDSLQKSTVKSAAPKTPQDDNNSAMAPKVTPENKIWPPDNLARRPIGSSLDAAMADRRQRSLTAGGDEIGRGVNAAKFSVAAENRETSPSAGGVALNGAPRPPPPMKPAHLVAGVSASNGAPNPRANLGAAPPPPPSRPPSQRPPLEEVKSRRDDFLTLRGAPSGLAQPAVRSTSDENLNQMVNTRPAPPPPPQRPPPLPPSLGRPMGAPPPPPVPKMSVPATQAPPSDFIATRRPSMPVNGVHPSQPESAPPPPPPRTDSLASDFERRFRFRTLGLLPKSDGFKHEPKTYPSRVAQRRSAPKLPPVKLGL